MNIRDFIISIYPRVISFKLARLGMLPVQGPITLTFPVTNMCQSRCKTCMIWKIYLEGHHQPEEELQLDEIERIFRSLGHVYFFNLTGGEPFLRDDLPEIVELGLKYLKPRIIHLPTNGIAAKRVIQLTKEILARVSSNKLKPQVTVKPSIDGIGEMHDHIRGVPGNWKQLLATIDGLHELESEYPNFHLELGTVISNYNKNHLDQIEEFVHSLGVQSYRNEIAQQREELLNVGEPITPTGEEYAELMKGFSEKIRSTMYEKKPLARVTEALRLVYYDQAVINLIEKRQHIPCFAGISNVQMTPYGELWPCCVLGPAKPLGSLRESDYDFWKVWHSDQAEKVRLSIKNKECACPMANQAYSNILCHTPSLLKAMRIMLRI